MKQGRQNKRIVSFLVSFVLLFATLCGLASCGKKLESIEITTEPNKVIYTAGEKFDPTGMVVTANYSKGDSEEVTDYTYDLTGALKETDTKVVVSYEDKTAEVSIKVINLVTGIAIKTHATKTTYQSGEVFDPAGMVLTVTYADDTTKDIAFADLGVTYSKEPLQVGQTEVEIKYEGETVKETITVTRGNYIETAIDNDFASTKANVKTFVSGSIGTVLGDGVFQNNGTTGPKTGVKGFDHPNRWITYTFNLSADGKVDFVWNIAGSHWVDTAENNPGTPDLGTAVAITIDDTIVIDGRGISLPGGTVAENNVWWNLQKVVAKDVELKAGEHTFKAVAIDDDVTDGYDGINIAYLSVYSEVAYANDRAVVVRSASLVEKDSKPYIVVSGACNGYEENDFSLELVKLSDSSSINVTSVATLADGGIFTLEADLSDLEIGGGDMIAKIKAGSKTYDLEFDGKADGSVNHFVIGSKSYDSRFESSKTGNKPVMIFTVESAFSASIDAEFVSTKQNSLVLNYNSAGTSTNGKLSGDDPAPEGAIGNVDTKGKYVVYQFKTSEKGLVDLVLRLAGSHWVGGDTPNKGIPDLGKVVSVTIDGISISTDGIELPSGENTADSPRWWNLMNIVLKNVELEAGEHTLRIEVVNEGVGGVNVGDLTIYGEKTLANVLEYKSELIKGSLDETDDKSTKNNKLTFVFGSDGFAHSDGVKEKTPAQTGPEHGTKGLDEAGRWISYTFVLQEAGKVDFVWQIAGSKWESMTVNPGVDDLWCTSVITIDGVRVDVRGIELRAADSSDLTEIWWNMYDLIIKDVELSAGEHTFRVDALGNGGVNVNFLKVYSDNALNAMSSNKAERKDVGSYETTNENEKTYVGIVDGVKVSSSDVKEKTEAQTGPDHGIKGLDSAGRWISYTFTLAEDGNVDFIWEVAGSCWVGSTERNPGVDDLSKYMIILIDDKAVDVSGIALPAGDLNVSLENLWWNLYDVVIGNVELSAGEHTFKAISLGTAGLNIKSMTVTSSSAIA